MKSSHTERDWMGLEWTEPVAASACQRTDLPDSPGLYKLVNFEGALIYVGESTSLRRRLASHLRDRHRFGEFILAFVETPQLTAKCQRLELENDLIAGYFVATGYSPLRQFGATVRQPL